MIKIKDQLLSLSLIKTCLQRGWLGLADLPVPLIDQSDLVITALSCDDWHKAYYNYQALLEHNSVLTDKPVALICLTRFLVRPESLSTQLLDDPDVILLALTTSTDPTFFLREAGPTVLNDPKIAQWVAERRPEDIRYLGQIKYQARDLVLTWLTKGQALSTGLQLKQLSRELRADYQIVSLMVVRYGCQLAEADPQLQDQSEIVELAVTNVLAALQYASSRLRNDLTFLVPLIEEDPRLLRYAGDQVRGNKDLVKRYYGYLPVGKLGPELLNDREIAYLYLYQDPGLIGYFNPSFRQDPDLMFELILRHRRLSLADPELLTPDFLLGLAKVDKSDKPIWCQLTLLSPELEAKLLLAGIITGPVSSVCYPAYQQATTALMKSHFPISRGWLGFPDLTFHFSD